MGRLPVLDNEQICVELQSCHLAKLIGLLTFSVCLCVFVSTILNRKMAHFFHL